MNRGIFAFNRQTQKCAVIASLLVATSLTATDSLAATSSVSYSGNQLLSNCEENGVNRSFCLGFIRGVVNGAAMIQNEQRPLLCVPSGVTVGQLTDIVVQGLRIHPESRHMDAGFLSLIAVAAAFPCSTSKAK